MCPHFQSCDDILLDGEVVLLHLGVWHGAVQGGPLLRDPLHLVLHPQPDSSGCGKVGGKSPFKSISGGF